KTKEGITVTLMLGIGDCNDKEQRKGVPKTAANCSRTPCVLNSGAKPGKESFTGNLGIWHLSSNVFESKPGYQETKKTNLS
ncbi:hypothetical protein, partial [Escherichia coli]|uniref:hypothetical protein n=1 Tax=Escherichia coli TaxID=562 RepID=UPI001AD8E3FE